MLPIEIIVPVAGLVVGVPNTIIDLKHRKNYEPGNGWEYYSNLAKQGSREGKFMIRSTVFAFYLVLAIIGDIFYELSR